MPSELRKEFPVGTLEEYSGLTIEAAFDKLLTLPYFEDIVALAEVDLIRSKLKTFTIRANEAIYRELEWTGLTREPAKELQLPMSLSRSYGKSNTPLYEEKSKNIKIATLYNCVYVLSLWLDPQAQDIYDPHTLTLSELKEQLMPKLSKAILNYNINKNRNKKRPHSKKTPKTNEEWRQLECFRNVAVLTGKIFTETNTQTLLLSVSGLLAEQTAHITGSGEKQEVTWRKVIANQIQEDFGHKIISSKSKNSLKRQLDENESHHPGLYSNSIYLYDRPFPESFKFRRSKKPTLEAPSVTDEIKVEPLSLDLKDIDISLPFSVEQFEGILLTTKERLEDRSLITNKATLFYALNNPTPCTDYDEFDNAIYQDLATLT